MISFAKSSFACASEMSPFAKPSFAKLIEFSYSSKSISKLFDSINSRKSSTSLSMSVISSWTSKIFAAVNPKPWSVIPVSNDWSSIPISSTESPNNAMAIRALSLAASMSPASSAASASSYFSWPAKKNVSAFSGISPASPLDSKMFW